jgi:hypothetical protein
MAHRQITVFALLICRYPTYGRNPTLEAEDFTMTNDYELREGGADYALEPPLEPRGDEASLIGRPIPIDQPLPIDSPILPWLVSVSGLYTHQAWPILPQPFPRQTAPAGAPTEGAERSPLAPVPWWRRREELRVDVDRHDPQATVSGTIFSGLTERLHWIASLTPSGPNQWSTIARGGSGSFLALASAHRQEERPRLPPRPPPPCDRLTAPPILK